MNSSLVPVFRSDSQLAVLEAVLSADGPISTRQVIDRTGLSQPLAQRELKRLADAGVFRESRIGRSALFVADEMNPAVSPLRALVTIALGPQVRLADALRDIPGIERALIFGSFAARSAGILGSSPDDIDLLIVGAPDRRAVYDALQGVDEAVRREVNVTFLRPERWQEGSEELVTRIRSNPAIELDLG